MACIITYVIVGIALEAGIWAEKEIGLLARISI